MDATGTCSLCGTPHPSAGPEYFCAQCGSYLCRKTVFPHSQGQGGLRHYKGARAVTECGPVQLLKDSSGLIH